MASRSVQPFLHSSPMCPTQTQTDTQTTLRVKYVAISRIFGLSGGDVAYCYKCRT